MSCTGSDGLDVLPVQSLDVLLVKHLHKLLDINSPLMRVMHFYELVMQLNAMVLAYRGEVWY